MITNNKTNIALIVACLVSIFFIAGVLAAPNGADVTPIKSERGTANNAGNASAYAGNVTEIDLYAESVTQTWQGYFGNITGVIQLADAADKVMYNWSLISPQGEVFASTNSTIQWANIQCFNFTANGSRFAEGGSGGTSLYGTNLTQLETTFGLSTTSSDGVDETFTSSFNHGQFYVGAVSFSAGQCRSTNIFRNTGKGEATYFDEALLYEPITSSVVFTSILENNEPGFDSRTHDFEMMVLENGHGVDNSVTPYYFFVELE
jgi:hypothetical protein